MADPEAQHPPEGSRLLELYGRIVDWIPNELHDVESLPGDDELARRGGAIAQELDRLAARATAERWLVRMAEQAALWVRTAARLLTQSDEVGLDCALVKYAEAASAPNPLGLRLTLPLLCPAILNAAERFEMSAHVITWLLARPEVAEDTHGTRIASVVWAATLRREVAARLNSETIKRAVTAAKFLPSPMQDDLVGRLSA